MSPSKTFLAKVIKAATFFVAFVLFPAALAIPAHAANIITHDYTYDHHVFTLPHAERCNESGMVILALQIDPDGFVTAASIVESSAPPDVDEVARQSALGWRYHASGKTRRKKVKVYAEAQASRVMIGDCSAGATKAYAKALASAPLYWGRTPKDVSGLTMLDPRTKLIELNARERGACTDSTTTKMIVVTVSADGTVTSMDPGDLWSIADLDHAALDLAKSLHFRPAARAGEPMPVTVPVWMTPRSKGQKCLITAE